MASIEILQYKIINAHLKGYFLAETHQILFDTGKIHTFFFRKQVIFARS